MSVLKGPTYSDQIIWLEGRVAELEEQLAAAKKEIEQLRWYGNKDCTHQADEELRRLGYPL